MSLQSISIILEAMIFVVCLVLAIRKKRLFAYGFALTFLIYAFYDSVQFFGLPVNGSDIYFGFFLATVSAFLGTILMYIEEEIKPKRRRR